MEYLTRKVRAFAEKYFYRAEPVEFSRKDAYLNFAHRVLTWEDPGTTWTVLLVLHFVFWLIIQLEIRIYSLIFLTLLFAFILDAYFERQGLVDARSASSDALRHLYDVFMEMVRYLEMLRRDSPSAFCMTMCIFFLALNFIARNLSGYLFVYVLLLVTFFGPLLISKLPEEHVESFKNAVKVVARSEGELAEQELIPFIRDKDFNEGDMDLDSLTDKTGDSVNNSLISGITSMPSHLDVEADVQVLEEEDLEPSVTPSQDCLLSRIPAIEYSSDSDESEHRNIEFKSSHFNPDSSSEEDSSYAKGLQFTDAKEREESLQQPSLGGILGNLGSIGSSLVSNVIKTAVMREAAPKKQDSDSDFEIIGNDELDDQ